ncbi:MAG TPA: DUF58 domain-containing protein [Acidimicrobiia bacterium]
MADVPPPAMRVVTRRGWTLLGASLGLLVAGRILGSVELAVLATGGIALLVTAVLWVRRRSFDLAAHREVRPQRLQVGGDGRVDLAVANDGSRRTPQLTVTDVFDDGRRAARFLLQPLPPGEQARAAYRVPTSHRGRFRVGPLAVSATDPFGLARRTWPLGGLDDVTVCPRVHDIVAPSQPGGRLVAAVESVRARALASETGEEFLTLRAYELGDDLRRVHWRSTARTGELMVRQDEAQWRARAVVLLDVRPEAHDSASFEVAVEATASVVERLTRMRRRVEVITSAGQPLGRTRRGGGSGAKGVADQLATIAPGGDDRLAAVLASLRVRRQAALVVAVLGTAGGAEIDALARLTAHGAVTLVATRPPVCVPAGDRLPVPALPGAAATTPSSTAGAMILVDTFGVPFPIAWNETMTRWHLAALTSSPSSPSRR